MNIWLSAITLTDVERLEEVFMQLTPNGWRAPDWLVALRQALSK